VLEPYSLDKKFHVLGFGGEPNYMVDENENGKTSHCWNLNGQPFNNIESGKVRGTDDILTVY